MLLAEKYFKDNEEVLEQVRYHDLDKLFMYLFYNKKDVSKTHRNLNRHHDNDLEKTYLDYIEMVLDWESARYTKPDKPLNAYDTLYKYYPHLENEILPLDSRLAFRGIGMIWGIDFSAIDSSLAATVSHKCFDRNLVIELAGRKDCVLKILPPLTIEEDHLYKGLTIIKETLETLL